MERNTLVSLANGYVNDVDVSMFRKIGIVIGVAKRLRRLMESGDKLLERNFA